MVPEKLPNKPLSVENMMNRSGEHNGVRAIPGDTSSSLPRPDSGRQLMTDAADVINHYKSVAGARHPMGRGIPKDSPLLQQD